MKGGVGDKKESRAEWRRQLLHLALDEALKDGEHVLLPLGGAPLLLPLLGHLSGAVGVKQAARKGKARPGKAKPGTKGHSIEGEMRVKISSAVVLLVLLVWRVAAPLAASAPDSSL